MYDPEITGTLYQDAAGTTPVTAVEQPVGLMLDLSGRGNHATQATTTKRPVLSRRVNQMPSSSGVGVAPWQLIAGNTSSTSGTGVLPVVTAGASTLDGEPVNRVILSLAGGTTTNDRSGMFLNMSVVGPFSVFIKSLNATPSATVAAGLVFNTGGTKSIVSLTDGWVRIDGMTSLGATLRVQLLGTGGLDYADFLIGKASLTTATDAHLQYQRVNTATDYDADPAKFPAYLRFDGVDDALQTGNIDFTSTDKMTVWAGVLRASAGTAQEICGLTASPTNAGAFTLWASTGAVEGVSNTLAAFSSAISGTLRVAAQTLTDNTQAVLNGYQNSTGVNSRLNSGAINTVAAIPVANFANAPIYIGSRAGTSNFLSGRLYSLIVRGAQSSLSQIEATELYIKQKMRMP